MKKCFILALLLISRIIFTWAQTSTSTSEKAFFHQRDFGKYFIADVYAPFTKVHVGAGLNLSEYNISTSRNALYVLYNETNLGVEIPIFSSIRYRKGGKVTKWSVSLPISTNIWFDFFEQITAPILNTDYRFATGEINYLRQVNSRWLKNYAIKFIPLFHESTHLGDELTLFRQADSLPVVRVNVSYEVSELALTLNDPDGSTDNNHAFKIGARFLLNPSKGWYSIRSEEGDTARVVASRRWLEAYVQYQHQRSKGILASKKAVSILSLEVRNRVKFGYPFYLSQLNNGTTKLIEATNNEEYRPSLNGYIGWKFTSDPQKHPARFGIYLRGYLGINPHGQFRNIPFYQFAGIAFIFEN